MNNFGRVHPLDKLINDDSLFLLEAMVPFVEYQYKLPLIFFIKYRELTMIMQRMNDRNYISECGFDCHPKNQEEMLGSMLSFMPSEYANTFQQMKQMMSMMEMMNSMPGQPPEYNEHVENETNSGTSDDLYESVMSILNERT
ncbi:MAG: hypothetical protein NC393_02140 [Clostridium sp.]|nr:hypothetical protein [Clostridium sp.]MCM1170905.1 hypothetical protein [Clostridium sp.]MCM1207339.1 hypothetical protein [Ruminococcus sp.]